MPAGDGAALFDPKTVLLVDDGDCDFAEVDPFLDERVGADQDLRLRRIILHRPR